MSRRGDVLVLENDPLIRQLVERWLGDAGFSVVSPEGAAARIVLVIADVPEPNSADAIITALQEYAAPILVLSARFRRGLGASTAAARQLRVKKVLPKPFTRRELLTAVRELLEGPQ